ncbi:AraC family transcriptional regulator [Nocardia sp. NBC_01327]|uniref:AraC family transcriptional regulator n=1 Tax=Nocardia sp. NBC_01327 TaxID=2903593 RepID=UPI002E11D166|nr:helix-turn-helix domain-containing protein [Nocardia sp. NBC_01327]
MAWEIARPLRASALHGVDMAGFRIHDDGPSQLRAIPHPAVTVVVEFGDRCFDVRDSAGRSHSGSLALGLGGSPAPVRVEAIECVQVRLSPVAASAILGFPLAELSRKIVGLEDIWGRDAMRLRERLHESHSWPERFALVDMTLSARLREDRRVDPEIAWAWRQITRSRGRFRVEHLATRVGWSRQRLWSRFGTQIGLTPKRAAMLVRFDHAVHRLVLGHPPAQVAADGGYADQSHLYRDVRDFTGAPLTSATGEPWLAVDDRAWPSSAASA